MLTAKELRVLAESNGACEEAVAWLKSMPDNSDPLFFDHLKKTEWIIWCVGWLFEYERWEEAEKYIVNDAPMAYAYARFVLRERWPEAEPAILDDHETTRRYEAHVVGGNWKEFGDLYG